MQRRSLLKAAAASPLAVGLAGLNAGAAAEAARPQFRNEDFYTDGQFDVEKGKDGVLALCRWYGYPIFPGLREGLWVSDYGAGQFMQLGLPGQVCPFDQRRFHEDLDPPRSWHPIRRSSAPKRTSPADSGRPEGQRGGFRH